MNIEEFINNYRNHPILFVGTGTSLRYLKQSYTWDELLRKVAFDLTGSNEYYLDIKSSTAENGSFRYDKIASKIESDFTDSLVKDRNGKFKEINDIFYSNMEIGKNISRFKIYVSSLLASIETKQEMVDELTELKKIGKNIGSIITTNYDTFIETFLDFVPLIGNDILLSNPYGSVYKIHGCITNPEKIIITNEDYIKFDNKYELIRAQLLSLFIHNPIIFIGYSVGDINIKNLLKTIFTYVEPDSEQANIIKNNFLLIERDADSDNDQITDHDIDIEGFPTIRINKIKTNNFGLIYKSIANLTLPISAMDIRKVQSIVKEIYSGGNIKVKITEDLESLKNSEKILAIGSEKSIQYQYMTCQETANNYFKIIEESNSQLLELIDKYKIATSQYFPIFAFAAICPTITRADALKEQQLTKLNDALDQVNDHSKNNHTSITDILEDASISPSNKSKALLWALMHDQLDLQEVEVTLKNFKNFPNSNTTEYRKILCAFDYKRYGNLQSVIP